MVRNRRRRIQFGVIFGTVGVAGVAIGVAIVGWWVFFAFRSDPWRAKVISIDPRVCTVPDRGVKDPGWKRPLCFEDGLITRDGQPITVVVGQCVELQVYHPNLAANRVVPCA